MGGHHYIVEAIPRLFGEKHYLSIKESLDDEWAWEEHANPSRRYLEKLRGLLPNDTSLGDVEEYKSDKDWGSDIKIAKDGDKIEGILLRYSIFTDSIELLKAFVILASDEGCLLYAIESGKVYEPDIGVIMKDLKDSKAFSFMENQVSAIVEAVKGIRNAK